MLIACDPGMPSSRKNRLSGTPFLNTTGLSVGHTPLPEVAPCTSLGRNEASHRTRHLEFSLVTNRLAPGRSGDAAVLTLATGMVLV